MCSSTRAASWSTRCTSEGGQGGGQGALAVSATGPGQGRLFHSVLPAWCSACLEPRQGLCDAACQGTAALRHISNLPAALAQASTLRIFASALHIEPVPWLCLTPAPPGPTPPAA